MLLLLLLVGKVQNGFSDATSSSIGTNIYKDQHFDDLPPPIPPRYPDMIQEPQSPSPPPPPPPSMPPPGPPEYENKNDSDESEQENDDIENILVQYEKSDSLEDSHDVLPWYLNGSAAKPEDNGKSEEPPCPPPRVESVYREKESPSLADHFLALGRGGEITAPPLPPPTQQASPLQPKQAGENPHVNDFNEEEALINELNELEKMVSQCPKDRETSKTEKQEDEDEATL